VLRIEGALLALLVGAISFDARVVLAASDVGRRVFMERCAPCHGDAGGGDGPAAAAITPPPRNFRDPVFWRGRTAQQLRLVVRDGKPGTMMAPFQGVLSDAEIDGVVGYLESFRPSPAPDHGEVPGAGAGKDAPR
jgi:mono/diheme cytochrome c family protein